MNSTQVTAFAEITYRQLDHWARLGLLGAQVQSPGSGVSRDWTWEQARKAKTMGRLVHLGFGVPLAASVADCLSAGWLVVPLGDGLSLDTDASWT